MTILRATVVREGVSERGKGKSHTDLLVNLIKIKGLDSATPATRESGGKKESSLSESTEKV